MDNKLPTNTKVVVIGGGVAGCSVAYHLAKYGWKDTVLLERDQLTSGTTWHAAGLVGQLGASSTITRLRKYSLNLYKELEKKTGLSTGLKQNGAITVASTPERLQELLRQATAAQLFDVNVETVTKERIKELYPVINDEDILGGVYMPEDGQADPVGVTNVLAKAAKMEGAKIFEKTPVEKILIKDKKIIGVQTKFGKIDCEYVVIATGMWSRQIGEDIGVSIPLYPNEHFYIITEPLDKLPKNLPVLRDYNSCLYLKEDAGKMLVGIFEPNAKPAFKDKGVVPEDFSFGEFPVHNQDGTVTPNFKSKVLNVVTGEFKLFKIPIPYGHIWDSFLRVFMGLTIGIILGVPLGLFMGLNRFAKGFFDPIVELYRPVPPLAWAPLVITVFGIDNVGKVFLLFMVSFSIMIISARAGASGTQLSKIHASHSLGASRWQILRHVIFPNSLPEILTGIRVAVGMCWGTLVAAEFLAGTTGIGFVENVARKYMQYEVIWITIFVMGMLGLLFDVTIRKIIDKTIPWRGKG